MASTVSVSKGCFVFNKTKAGRQRGKKKVAKQDEQLYGDPWYLSYRHTWKWVEENIQDLQQNNFSKVLDGLVSFVTNAYEEIESLNQVSVLPTAALLTGINMPDHGPLFSSLLTSLRQKSTPHVALLYGRKCSTLRAAIEQMVRQFMSVVHEEDILSDESEDSDEERQVKLKKSQCNLQVLHSWYKEKYPMTRRSCTPSPRKKGCDKKADRFPEVSNGKSFRESPSKQRLTKAERKDYKVEELEDKVQIIMSMNSGGKNRTEDIDTLKRTSRKKTEVKEKEKDCHGDLLGTPRKGSKVRERPGRSSLPWSPKREKGEECSSKQSPTKAKILVKVGDESESFDESDDDIIVTSTKGRMKIIDSPQRTPRVERETEEVQKIRSSSTRTPCKESRINGGIGTPKKNNAYVSPYPTSPRIDEYSAIQSPGKNIEIKECSVVIRESVSPDGKVSPQRSSLCEEKSLEKTPNKKSSSPVRGEDVKKTKDLRMSPRKKASSGTEGDDDDDRRRRNFGTGDSEKTGFQRTPRKREQKDIEECEENCGTSPWKVSRMSRKADTESQVRTSPSKSPSKLHCSTLPNQKQLVEKRLVVIIPDFEKFPVKVMQDLILILRNYTTTLPFILVLGIATSVMAVHRNLPYKVTACLSIKVFHSPPSVDFLNSVLEQVLFSPRCPFRLGTKSFNFLMDVFLCYDLSVKGFVQAFKFCMMEHFGGQDWKRLCCSPENLKKKYNLTSKDISALRELPTFSHYLKDLESEEKEKLLKNDEYMEKVSLNLLRKLHKTLNVFHRALYCLNILTGDLPNKPLGNQVRELYGMAASSPIFKTPEYKTCFQLLGFLSRDELLAKLSTLHSFLEKGLLEPELSILVTKIVEYKDKILKACVTLSGPSVSPVKLDVTGKMNRHMLLEKLTELSQKPKTEFEIVREEFFQYLAAEAFPVLLAPPVKLPLAEVVFFDNITSIRAHIVGAPRAAIHTALNNPQFYLECDCCSQTGNDAILASMPDIVIAYKLYRECGRFINLYDWLQAFAAIVSSKERDEQKEIELSVQARFTRAVAELQYMGFVKTSSRKVDHVVKLSFDGGF